MGHFHARIVSRYVGCRLFLLYVMLFLNGVLVVRTVLMPAHLPVRASRGNGSRGSVAHTTSYSVRVTIRYVAAELSDSSLGILVELTELLYGRLRQICSSGGQPCR
jgi:hypothetical protein